MEKYGDNTFKCTYTPDDTSNYNIVTGIDVIIKVTDKLEVTIEKYKIKVEEDSKVMYISNIKVDDTLKDVRDRIKTNGTITIYEYNGSKVTDNTKVAKTGMKVKIETKTESVEYTLVVTGDNNGDGKITITDVVRSNLHMTNLKHLENEFKLAADVNDNGEITITDVVKTNLASVHLITL